MRCKRDIQLTITRDSDKSILLVSGKLRVDFLVEKMVGNALNTAKITVYNLATDTLSSLANSGTETYKVKLDVGGLNDISLTTLFEGDLINFHNTPLFQDNITILWCWEKGIKGMQGKLPNQEPYHNLTVKQIANSLVAKLGNLGEGKYNIDFANELKGHSDEMVKVFYPNKTVLESLNNLLGTRGMTFVCNGNNIKVTNTLCSPEDNKLLSERGSKNPFKVLPLLLKKPVQFSIATSEVHYNLAPSAAPLEVMYIDYNLVQQSQTTTSDKTLQIVGGVKNLLPKDYYLIIKVTHMGSLYTDTWDTTIRGITYNYTNEVSE